MASNNSVLRSFCFDASCAGWGRFGALAAISREDLGRAPEIGMKSDRTLSEKRIPDV
jgi:hypothetical protein